MSRPVSSENIMNNIHQPNSNAMENLLMINKYNKQDQPQRLNQQPQNTAYLKNYEQNKNEQINYKINNNNYVISNYEQDRVDNLDDQNEGHNNKEGGQERESSREQIQKGKYNFKYADNIQQQNVKSDRKSFLPNGARLQKSHSSRSGLSMLNYQFEDTSKYDEVLYNIKQTGNSREASRDLKNQQTGAIIQSQHKQKIETYMMTQCLHINKLFASTQRENKDENELIDENRLKKMNRDMERPLFQQYRYQNSGQKEEDQQQQMENKIIVEEDFLKTETNAPAEEQEQSESRTNFNQGKDSKNRDFQNEMLIKDNQLRQLKQMEQFQNPFVLSPQSSNNSQHQISMDPKFMLVQQQNQQNLQNSKQKNKSQENFYNKTNQYNESQPTFLNQDQKERRLNTAYLRQGPVHALLSYGPFQVIKERVAQNFDHLEIQKEVARLERLKEEKEILEEKIKKTQQGMKIEGSQLSIRQESKQELTKQSQYALEKYYEQPTFKVEPANIRFQQMQQQLQKQQQFPKQQPILISKASLKYQIPKLNLNTTYKLRKGVITKNQNTEHHESQVNEILLTKNNNERLVKIRSTTEQV